MKISLSTAFLRTVASVAMVAMLGSAMAAPAANNPAGDTAGKGPIRIGYVIPLSGQSAEPGQKIVNGMKLYLEQIHNKIAGRPVEMIIESDDSSPATAVAKVHKLMKEDKVPLMSGMFLTNCLYAIAPVVEEYKTPFVVVSSGADEVTQRKRKKWIVRTCYTASMPAHPMGEYAAKTLKYKKVATICSDYGYGYEVAAGFQQTFEENGGKVIQKLWSPLGFKDFSELVKQIRPDADAIFLCVVGQSAEIVPKQIRQAGFKQPFIGLTASFDESFYPRMDDSLTGGISASLYSTSLNTPANKKFVKEYNARYGEDPSYFSEHGYSAMMFIHKALESIKGDVEDKDKVMAALRKVEIKDAPRGPIKMDEYGTSIDNVYVRKVERKNGKLQNTVIHTYPLVSQFWKYDPEKYMANPPYSKDYPPCCK